MVKITVVGNEEQFEIERDALGGNVAELYIAVLKKIEECGAYIHPGIHQPDWVWTDEIPLDLKNIYVSYPKLYGTGPSGHSESFQRYGMLLKMHSKWFYNHVEDKLDFFSEKCISYTATGIESIYRKYKKEGGLLYRVDTSTYFSSKI